VFAIGQPADGVLGLSGLAVADPCSRRRCQLEVARHEVRVNVGVDDRFDGQSVPFGVGKVLADVATRVDNDCATCCFVADHV
jgi:hypothetical protein